MEHTKDLVDIATVNVDTSLPKEERKKEFIRQIKNPYHFISHGVEVTTSYAKTSLTLEQCVMAIITQKNI